MAGLPKIAPKSEFESTADYQARVSAARSDPTLIIQKPLKSKIPYNADKRQFEIPSTAFGWPTEGGNIIVSGSYRTTGSYVVGSNAFGVKVQVSRGEMTFKTLSHRLGHGAGIFPSFKFGDNLDAVPANPDEARRLQSQIQLAFVVHPKPPYQKREVLPGSTATITHLEDVLNIELTLVSDVECGLLLDGANKVIRAYAAQPPT